MTEKSQVDASDIDLTTELSDRPFEPWFTTYLATSVTPGALASRGALGTACVAAASLLVTGLLTEPTQKGRGTFTRSLGFMIFDAYWLNGDEAWTAERPDRPLRSWLTDYLGWDAQVLPLGTLGAECRDAADRLVTDLLADPTMDNRSAFTRSLASLIYDAYVRDGWAETVVW